MARQLKVLGHVCCVMCGVRFSLKYRKTKTCSKKCSEKLYRAKSKPAKDRNPMCCQFCGVRTPFNVLSKRTCSKECSRQILRIEEDKENRKKIDKLRNRKYHSRPEVKKKRRLNDIKNASRITERRNNDKKIKAIQKLQIAIAFHV